MKRTVRALFGAGGEMLHTQDKVNRMLVAAICASVGSLLSDSFGWDPAVYAVLVLCGGWENF